MDVNKLKQGLQFVGKWEWGNHADGGYTNDPTDPGGETKFGISKRAHPNEDIKNLTAERALAIYQTDYWTPIGGDNLALPTCVVAFDSAVNCGVSRVKGWLVDTKDDWQALINRRKQYYLDLVKAKPALQRYLKGWLNRLGDLQKYCELVTSND